MHDNQKQIVGSSPVKLEGKGWYTEKVIACVSEHSAGATYTDCVRAVFLYINSFTFKLTETYF